MKAVSNQQSAISRIYILAFLILSFAFGAYAQGAGQPTTGAQADLTSDFDVNGLRVIVKRRPNAPTVAAGLFIRGGSRNLTLPTAGIENLMLSTAAEASKQFPRDVMRKELTKMASNISAGANEDFSTIALVSTRPNFDRTWEIFTDAVMNPAFAQGDFDLVRNRILTALKNQSISPDSALNNLQDRVVYANHPYANDPNGTPETIASFKLDDIRAYHQKVMTTSQLLLVVVGDVDPAVLQKRVAESLGKLPRGSYKETPLPQLAFDKPTLDITTRAIETNYIKGVFAAPSLSNPDYYAMRVAMTLLQSKVINEVRNKRQLSYAPNAEMADDAANTANIYVTANDANQSVSLMLEEIEKMKAVGVDEEEFTGLPGYFLTTYFIKQETNASQVAELARYELIGGGWRNSLSFIDKMLAVKPADVKTVANKYMKNIRFVVIGNPAAINKQVFTSN
ncbi:MAG TPA: pitrilysin family protein [Pyrinomonadaceae bacterium]|jgi:predicted Zn-dependent peptidase